MAGICALGNACERERRIVSSRTDRVQRISCVIGSLGPGGAERVLTTMANWWAMDGRDVTIHTLQSTPAFFRLDDRVAVVPMRIPGRGTVRRTIAAVRRVLHLRRELRIRRPDVVLSFIDVANIHTLLATIGMGVPVVVSERTDPSRHRIGVILTLLRRLTYPMAARLVVQSSDVESALPYMSNRATVIANPVLPAPAGGSASVRDVDVIAMGRFTPEKGFDLLLRAVAVACSKRGPTTLRVWGDGPERVPLMRLAEQLDIVSQVEFPGNTTSPSIALRRGRVFVLPSRYEGFPNVLGEAMAVGLASIAFDSSSGPRQLIRHGIDGLLIAGEDVNAMAAAIVELLDCPVVRRHMEAAAPNAVERFSLESVMARWDNVLASAVR